MRLLLDTTYFLPAIGISVRNLPKEAVVNLIKKGHEVMVSEITFFELSAKGAKYVVNGKLSPERVCRGIRAIKHDERIKVIPIHDTSILLTAFKLRRILDDFTDCIILSSAINQAEVLITEDEDIRRVSEEACSLKHGFRIIGLREVL
ncbi:MAG: PIN domain-containing protein [Thaumarchaeota archaeon]|nr:PIN domain-containing protein [Nitrososphaerota archaeon]